VERLERITGATVDVLRALRAAPGPQWGLLIIKATGRPAGSVYPILERLEQRGWVVSSWEDDKARSGPRRRLYRFTPDGAEAAIEVCTQYDRRATGAVGRLRPT
jgi:DNA-binding IclR family transcriptional regulator